MRAPRFSVVLPTFDRRDLVVEAIASVEAQRFRDYELIVVDDGSTDGTRDAVAGRPGLIYVWQENRGEAVARNEGVARAHGELVAFLDSDCLWRPNHLEVMDELARTHPEAILFSTHPYFAPGGRARPAAAELTYAFERLLIETFVGTPSAIAVRRSALTAAGPFDPSLSVATDADMWLRLSLDGPFALLRHDTTILRRTPASLMERGRELGTYARAFRRSAERVAAAADPQQREWIAGSISFLDAIQAAVEGDEPGVSRALEAACRQLPRLSEEPALVSGRLRFLGSGGGSTTARARELELVARAWPAQRSDTARVLRAQALVAALRARTLRAAAGLARELHPLALTAVAWRRRRAVADSSRRALRPRPVNPAPGR